MGRKRIYRCPNCRSKMVLTEEGSEDCASRYDCTTCGCYAVFFEEEKQ
jgi:transposase-like protein